MSTDIPKEELFEHAKISATIQTAVHTPGMESWLGSKISKEPTKIYDINGELLFLDFPVQSKTRGAGVTGYVRVGSKRNIGSPIISYELGPKPWNFNASVEKLTPVFNKKFPKLKVKDVKLVCYSYPKLGVMFKAVDATGSATRHIFDVASLAQVPEKKEKAVEGFYAWSYLDSLTDEMKTARLKQHEEARKSLKEIPENERASMLKAEVFGKYASSKYVGTILVLFETKLLQYCTHYNYNETRSHHCFVLQGQQKDDYCAVATCQMILCYYRYYYSQDQIAPALNYSPGLGCPPDQSAGYEKLTCNHLDATFDSTPTWAKAKTQIDGLHPFKSGIDGHARACAGYSSSKLMLTKSLYIYDPWPWNADLKLGGSIKWENWNSITHTNYVFTKLTCP